MRPAFKERDSALRLMVAALLVLVAAATFYVHARIYWDWTEDDAFITYRYADNLAKGQGLVFNHGERVEGYSNFTWMLLNAAGVRAGLDPEALSKRIGLGAGLAALGLAWQLGRSMMPGGALVAVLAAFYVAVSPAVVVHSVAGLESSFFAALLLLSIVLASQARTSLMRSSGLILVLTLLAMSRPEAPIVAAVILGARAFCLAPGARRRVLFEALAVAVPFVTYYVWRWSYFGAFFANTYYAKARGGLHGMIDGAQYTLDFMRDAGGIAFVAAAVVPLLLGKTSPVYRLALAVVAVYTGLIIISGGDWMYNYRFYSHIVPVMAALIVTGVDRVLRLVRPSTARATFAYATAGLALLATFMSIGNTELKVARIVLPALESHNYLSQNYEELGLWLRDNTPADATVAISDVGAVGYFSQRRILDMFGLVDRCIARLPGRVHYKADPKYVLSQEPDYIVLISLGDGGGGYSFMRIPDYMLNNRTEFHDKYELVRSVPHYFHNEYALIYRRERGPKLEME